METLDNIKFDEIKFLNSLNTGFLSQIIRISHGKSKNNTIFSNTNSFYYLTLFYKKALIDSMINSFNNRTQLIIYPELTSYKYLSTNHLDICYSISLENLQGYNRNHTTNLLNFNKILFKKSDISNYYDKFFNKIISELTHLKKSLSKKDYKNLINKYNFKINCIILYYKLWIDLNSINISSNRGFKNHIKDFNNYNYLLNNLMYK